MPWFERTCAIDYAKLKMFVRDGAVMSEGFWPVVLIVVAVVIYIFAKVVFYIRKSRQQWQDVDRSKLRKWEEDEDW